MAQAETIDPRTPLWFESGHEGSAPFNLSGRAVLTAWVISVAAHALLFFGMLGLVFPFSASTERPEPLVVHAEILDSVERAPVTAKLPHDILDPTARPEQVRERPVPKEFTDLSKLTLAHKPDLAIIGIGAGGGGDFSKYGLTVGAGPGPAFFGLGQSARGARKIVYVVDRSGSMMDTFVYVQAELKRSIGALRRSQKFHVIFFNTGRPLENPPQRLVSAIDAHKEKFFDFLSGVSPSGGTKPGAALRRAIALEPDLVYLLSDGIDFEPRLHADLDEWNRARRVRIYTIAYLDRTGSELLEQIAREHHGEFKFVSEDDLP
jgi:hypothetical protein